MSSPYTSTALQTIDFMGLPVSVIDHNGQKWLTAEQVGQCLGYDPSNARKGVLKIFERHADEFGDADTGIVKLATRGGMQSARAFSATGCNKLGFFVQTSRAKDFRTWASRVLAGQTAQVTAPPPVDRLVDLAETNTRTLSALADNMHVLAQGVSLLLKRHETEGKYISLLEQQQRGYARINRRIEAQVLDMKLQGVPQADIARTLRISTSTVSKLISGGYTFTADAGEPHPEYLRLRAAVDELLVAQHTRKSASLFGDVAQRMGV